MDDANAFKENDVLITLQKFSTFLSLENLVINVNNVSLKNI